MGCRKRSRRQANFLLKRGIEDFSAHILLMRTLGICPYLAAREVECVCSCMALYLAKLWMVIGTPIIKRKNERMYSRGTIAFFATENMFAYFVFYLLELFI